MQNLKVCFSAFLLEHQKQFGPLNPAQKKVLYSLLYLWIKANQDVDPPQCSMSVALKALTQRHPDMSLEDIRHAAHELCAIDLNDPHDTSTFNQPSFIGIHWHVRSYHRKTGQFGSDSYITIYVSKFLSQYFLPQISSHLAVQTSRNLDG